MLAAATHRARAKQLGRKIRFSRLLQILNLTLPILLQCKKDFLLRED